jgi:hypothetical protein
VLPELNMSGLYIRFVGFRDDWMAPARSIEQLQDTCEQAVTRRECVNREQYQLKKNRPPWVFYQTHARCAVAPQLCVAGGSQELFTMICHGFVSCRTYRLFVLIVITCI